MRATTRKNSVEQAVESTWIAILRIADVAGEARAVM
jgi:hypothetical protein